MSDPDNGPLLIFLAVLVLLINAVIVLCNIAYSSVNSNTIFQKATEGNDKKSKNVSDILSKPFKYRYTDRLLNYILLICGAVLIIELPYSDWISAGIYALAAVTLSELLPRKLGILHCEKIVRSMAWFQKFLIIVFTPFVVIFTLITDIILKIFRQETKIEINRYSEEEVMSILEAGQQSGEIKEEGKKMINSIFEFDDELAYEIMTPRTDVFLIDIDDPPEEYIDELMALRYSRIPVCEGDSDNIIGILHIKDYLIKAREDGFDNVDIKSILRNPYFVPETKNIDALFFELQKEKQHIAVLIDEYGGFSGIVTMEDIIEEVMGDIDDEFDEEEASIEKIDENTFIVNGKEYLDDINEELGTDLTSDNSETIGGLIIDLLGEIPGEDEISRTLSYQNCIFTILSVKDRRIENIKLEIIKEESPGSDDSEGKEQK